MRFDIQNNIPLVTSAAAALTSSDNTAMTAPSGTTGYNTQGFSAVNLLIASATLADADATFAVEIRESETTNGTYTAVADADLVALETTVGFVFSEDNVVKQITVIPRKQFVRVVITPTGNSGAAPFTVVAQGLPSVKGTLA